MLNQITIMGRMTRDPEMRRTASGTAVASFTLAVDRDRVQDGKERETDFIDCVAWAGTAEFVCKYFAKGAMAIVSGRLQIRGWTDKEGNKRRSAEVVADHVWFGESKKNSEGSYTQNNDYARPGGSDGVREGGLTHSERVYNAMKNGEDYTMLEDDDAQLPF